MRNEHVSIPELQAKMQSILSPYHLSEADTLWIIDHYLAAELAGKSTHGLQKFCWDVQFYGDRLSGPKIVQDDQALALVDGQREIGPLAARFCIDLACTKISSHGLAIVALKNFQRFGVLSSWSSEFARRGLVGFVTNSTEPAAVAEAHVAGPAKPILGTNPLSIAVPFKNAPLLLDMSTTKAPLSTIWSRQKSDRKLPTNTFRDKNSKYTDDPNLAETVDTWGGVKGLNLSILLQVLCGPLLGVVTDSAWQDRYQVGALFVGFDPNRLSGSLILSNTEIRRFVRNLEASGILTPGTNSRRMRQRNLERGSIEVPLSTLRGLEKLVPV